MDLSETNNKNQSIGKRTGCISEVRFYLLPAALCKGKRADQSSQSLFRENGPIYERRCQKYINMTSAKKKFVRVFESVFPDLKRRRHIDGDQAVEVHPSRRAAMTVVAFASCILATAHLGVQTTAFAPQAFFRRPVKANAVGKAFSSTLSAGPVASDAAAYATTFEPELCRVSVLLCPAQFCVPVDYDALFHDLREAEIDGIEIGSVRLICFNDLFSFTQFLRPINMIDWLSLVSILKYFLPLDFLTLLSYTCATVPRGRAA